MAPILKNGDFLLCARPKPGLVTKGDIVLVQHEEYGLIVKRVKSVDRENGLYHLEGASSLSTASEHLGAVSDTAILGLGRYRISASQILPSRLSPKP